MRSVLLRLLLVIASLVAAVPAAAVTLGQIDDFQDGTTQGWGSGPLNPNPPVNVSNVGPAGVGDDSLMITSTGVGLGGSRFTAFPGTGRLCLIRSVVVRRLLIGRAENAA